MEFLKKLFGIKSNDNDYIGLSAFSNNRGCFEDEKPVVKKVRRTEPTLTELLKKGR